MIKSPDVTKVKANLTRYISLEDIAREPFRIFFPAAVVAGLTGVALWPLHFGGIYLFYPGTIHAHLMVHGFFAGFIFGVLGTGLPRMLSTKPFSVPEVLALFALHTAIVIANLVGKTLISDVLVVVLLVAFATCAVARIRVRQDNPLPGFILVALALVCLAAGTGLSIALANKDEPPLFWVKMQHLLSYQGFVLLPILGVGGFLLPRFFELPNKHDFPESRTPAPGWLMKAGWALLVGMAVLISLVIEAVGWERTAYAIRFAGAGAYLLHEVPIYRSRIHKDTIRACVALAIGLLLTGFLAVVFYPFNRVAILHLTLVGGFAVLTFSVATRVVFGHSGNQARLTQPNRWLMVAVGLMVLGMATRISGDFFPNIRVSHYNYGAGAWMVGALVWSIYVLPKIRFRDPEEA
jgi:uncharacterized protein involved in response to NO